MNQSYFYWFISLKLGSILLATCESIISGLMFIATGGAFIYFEQNQDEVLKMFQDSTEDFKSFEAFINVANLTKTSTRVFLGANIAYWLQRSLLGVFLFNAVLKANRTHCQIWMVYTIILLTFSALGYMLCILFGILGLMSIPVYVVLFCIREYSICLVSSFEKRFGGSLYEKALPDW